MSLSREQIEGAIYETPSGRQWRATYSAFYRGGRFLLTPLGSDTFGFGGVKARYVEGERLDGTDRTWKRLTPIKTQSPDSEGGA